jgi:hypothetical protein
MFHFEQILQVGLYLVETKSFQIPRIALHDQDH